MTSSLSILERQALDAVERRLSEQGYVIVREPQPSVLPNFLAGFQPDAIATGNIPHLLIEVVTRRGSGEVEATKIKQLQQLLAGHEDWQLEVVYTTPSAQLPAVSSIAAIRQRYEAVLKLVPLDRQAALVMAWSLLEATARTFMPDRAARPLTPATTGEMLTSLGYISQVEADRLREASKARNLIVHGDMDVTVSPQLLEDVLKIVDALTQDKQH